MRAPVERREQESVLRDLGSPDEEVRRLAVERIGLLPIEVAIPGLMERLGDRSWRVRKAAVERLLASSEPGRMAPSLIEALADGEDAGRRNAALEVLTRSGADALPHLLEASQSPDRDVRKQIVDALAGIGDPAAAKCLVAMLGDTDANVRTAAADALGEIGDETRAEPLLDRALADPERLVRLAALRSLARLELAIDPERLAPLHADPLLRSALLAVLGHARGEGARQALLEGLGSESVSSRDVAATALLGVLERCEPAARTELGERVATALRAAPGGLDATFLRMRSAPLPRRLAWIQLVARVGICEAALPLLDAARDEAAAEVALAALRALGAPAGKAVADAWHHLDPEARLFACRVLGGCPSPAAEELLRAALAAADPGQRAAAARALGECRAHSALGDLLVRLQVAALGEAASDEEELGEVTGALVRILGDTGSEGAGQRTRALAELASALPVARESVRLAAARVYAGIPDPVAEAALEALAADASPSVRRLAIDALGARGAGPVPEALVIALCDEASIVRSAGTAALAARAPEQLAAHLETLAADPDCRVRAAAARAAGCLLGGPAAGRTARTVLERSLAGEVPVALAAAEGLLRADTPEAAALARPLLEHESPELVQIGAACVARRGDGEVLASLLPLLSHPAWIVRAEAAAGLGARGPAHVVPALLRRLELEQDAFVREAILAALARLEASACL